MSIDEKIRKAENETNQNPTQRQIEAGNYRKGKLAIKGFKLSIENPRGSVRSGTDDAGREWSNTMQHPYGYFRGTLGKDGDPIDVYLGNCLDQIFSVYVIDQIDPTTKAFDEHKVMFGFDSVDEAKQAYLNEYEEGWEGFGSVTTMNISTFRNWLYSPKLTKQPASKMRVRLNAQSEPEIKTVTLQGEVVSEESLLDLQNQAGDIDKFDILVCEIRSPGGSVEEGLKIMYWFNELSSKGKEIITVVSANAYSIASLIMLAADKRLISSHGEVMVHNPMIPELTYVNADQLEMYVDELRDLEDMMYSIYQVFTGLDRDTIKSLMDAETFLKPQDAVKYGFADEVINIDKKPYEMAFNTNKIVNMTKTLNILNRVIGAINRSDIVNQYYYTESGGEVQITQQDPSTYSQGDRIDVQEDGEITLLNGDRLTIKDGVIEQIERGAAPNPDEMPEAPEAPEAAETVPVEETVASEFNEGPAPKDPEAKEHEETEMKEEEMVEEPAAPESAMEEAPIEAPVAPVIPVAPIETPAPTEESVPTSEELMEVVRTMQKTIENLTKQVNELTTEKIEGKVGELEKDMVSINDQLSNFARFETIATEAIESLAKHTTSSFKREAKVPEAPVASSRSIFQRLKAERGLK